MSKINTTKRISVCVMLIVMLFSVLFVPVAAAEEEAAAVEPSQVIALIEKLPVNSELVTIDNKDDILAAKEAFNALSVEQRLEVPTDKVVLLNSDYSVLVPYMLADLVKAIKELPATKKLSEKNKEDILSLYRDYQFLDEDAKAAFSSDHKDTLIAAVNKLAPDQLAEEDKPKESEENKEEKDEKKSKSKINWNKVWQIALMVVATLIVLLTLVALIILIVKMLMIRRKYFE